MTKNGWNKERGQQNREKDAQWKGKDGGKGTEME